MINRMCKVWNGKLLGMPMAFLIFIRVFLFSVMDKLNTILWSYNLGRSGKNILIQYSTIIRYPKKISIGDGSRIGKKCQISSEFSDSIFDLGENSFINKKCLIDFSGGLTINNNVTISEGVKIETHSHGLDPRSRPEKKPLFIDGNVWIGAHVTILPNVSTIGENSIIGAGSIVTKDVKPFSIIAGNPAKHIKDIPR